jgi:CheY-like chemotaxis protein
VEPRCYTSANGFPQILKASEGSSATNSSPTVRQAKQSVPIPTILCIDDEALGLEIRKAVLERAGYQVLTAIDGSSGLSLFRGNTIDGVVLDYYMPEMDGGAVAETMRRERPEIPIMLLSAYINLPAEVVELADVTLLKGEGPQELLEKLRAMLHSAGTSDGSRSEGTA